MSLGKQDSFDSWRPAPQPCDQEPQFSDLCDQFRQFCSGGSIWFRFKGIGEFEQHTGCSDTYCYSIVGYFFNYKLITRFDLSSCSRLVFCTQNCQLRFYVFFLVVFFLPPIALTCLSEGVKTAQASPCLSNGGYYLFYLFLGNNSMN